MAELTEFDFVNMPMEARRALARAQQAETGNNRLLARAMQMSGDPVFTGVGNSMDTEAALADQSLQQAAHGTIGHEVQQQTLKNTEEHQLLQTMLAKQALDQKTAYEGKQTDIAQQNADSNTIRAKAAETRAAAVGNTGQARALAAMEKWGKSGNIPGMIARLYQAAAMDRGDMLAGKLAGFVGTGKDPTMTWDMWTKGLIQEMSNLLHGGASKEAGDAFMASRPTWTDSSVKKLQWLEEVSGWGLENATHVNNVAIKSGHFPEGIIPQDTMDGWKTLDDQLFPKAPPMPTNIPVQGPQTPPGQRPLNRPPQGPPPGPSPQPTASGAPPGAPPAGPPGPTASPPPGAAPPGPQAAPPGPAPAPQGPPRIDGTWKEVRVQLPGHKPSLFMPVANAQQFLNDHAEAKVVDGR